VLGRFESYLVDDDPEGKQKAKGDEESSEPQRRETVSGAKDIIVDPPISVKHHHSFRQRKDN